MGLLAWVMMGIAIWHFTIFIPDRFWGGIVGASSARSSAPSSSACSPHRLRRPGRERHSS